MKWHLVRRSGSHYFTQTSSFSLKYDTMQWQKILFATGDMKKWIIFYKTDFLDVVGNGDHGQVASFPLPVKAFAASDPIQLARARSYYSVNPSYPYITARGFDS